MEICTVGGYEEVGKNMTAIKIGEDVIILDMGVYLPPIVELEEGERKERLSIEKLRRIGALPNDKVLDKLGWKDKVRAIIIGHAHLDHIGAVPYLANRYPNATIYASPFTMAVLNLILDDEKINLRNKKRVITPDSNFVIQGKTQNYKIDFVRTTHSTLQCVFPVIHTQDGAILYGLDFKLDDFPVIGQPPNYKKLKELGRKGVKILILDSLYSGTDRKTPSERIARDLLEEAFSSARNKNSALFVTTFSSHIARLKSIVDFGKRTKRQIIFIGRSLNKYVTAAIKVNKCPFRKNIKLIKYRKQINSMLNKVEKNRGKYLIVCTGHQAEPGSIMDRIVKGETPFKFKLGDNVIFSSSIIPTPVNILAREKMDKKLRAKGVKVQTDVHVSGHGSKEDMRELILMLKPQHLIPAHGSLQQEAPLIELASELGYKFGENSHLTSNGKVLKFENAK
ncbi:ribonuclease J [Candidatus Pacearchaeota archaeon]|nr:MAG: ribonuclease J [Candidatus Pacearchaeota archaeon]